MNTPSVVPADTLRRDLETFADQFAKELSPDALAALAAIRERCAAAAGPPAAAAGSGSGDRLPLIVAELEECRRATAVLMENLPGMVYRCRNDPAWSTEFASPGIAELTGYTAHEVVHRRLVRFGDLIHPDDRDRVWTEVQQAIGAGHEFVLTYRIRTRAGEEKWVRERGRGIYAAGRYLQALEGVVTDITVQVRAQEEMRRTAAYFQALIEHAFEAIFVLDTDGSIQYASPSVANLLGVPAHHLVGRNVLDLVHPDDHPPALAGIRAVASHGIAEPLEVRVRTGDGATRVLRVVGTNLTGDPAVRGIVVNARDISERRALSQRLSLEHAATALLAQSASEREALADLLPLLVHDLGWDAALFWAADEAAGVLRLVHAWDRRGAEPGAVPGAEGVPVLARGAGLPGEIWTAGEPRWMEQMDPRTHLDGSAAPGDGNRAAALAVPVRAGVQFLGVLEILCHGPPLEPDASRMQGMMTIGGVLGQFLSRLRAEQALRESERYFRSLTENALDMITVLDPRGIVRYKSPAVIRGLGYTPEAMIGLDIFSLVHPEDVAHARAVFELAVRVPQTPHPVELRLAHADGGWRRLAVTLSSLLADPAVRGVVANSRDVTAQRDAQAQLRRTHQTLAALVENAPLGIVAVDRDFHVTMWNPAAERIFGWTAGEVLGRPYPLVPPDRALEYEHLRDEVFVHGRVVNGIELVRLHRDGTRVEVFFQSVALAEEGGEISTAVGFFTDIRDRKRLQEQLLHSQKMEAVGQLAGGIAHDFNNLLTAIRGGAQLALMDVPGGSPLHDDLAAIDAAADRAAALTRQLLAFSRKQVTRPEVLDLNKVVRKLEPMLRRLIHEDIEFVVAAGGDPATVLADAGQMEQVLVNLAVNAADAMPGRGRLEIGVRQAAFPPASGEYDASLQPGAPAVLLTVRDAGSGIDRATMEHIFEPFFTTKGPGKGTGLGLAMVYGIVKQSGGHIGADSTVGAGTTFRIYLPRVDADATPAPAPRQRTGMAGGTERILLVEDERSVRELATRILSTAGYDVAVAGDGVEALERADALTAPADLLVTDVIMPRMGGHELAGRLAQRWSGMGVLYMSGYSADAIAHRGVLDPGIHLLEKPFSPEELLRAVRDMLDRPGRES